MGEVTDVTPTPPLTPLLPLTPYPYPYPYPYLPHRPDLDAVIAARTAKMGMRQQGQCEHLSGRQGAWA